MPDHGLAIASMIDRSVDEGQWARFQVLASEHREAQYTPKLEIRLRPCVLGSPPSEATR